MNKIEFISHEVFPDDEYTKELVYICLEGKIRVAYIRKKSQNGGLFWAPASIGAMKSGRKEYYPAFLQDSQFLERDIKQFLEERSWEVTLRTPPKPPIHGYSDAPRSMKEVAEAQQLPF